MSTEIIIQENDLELVVSEKTLGSLTTNAKQIRDIVKAALPRYDISNYSDENIDQAKKDKAALNKAAKALNDKRIEIEREFMNPFSEFKEIANETVALISECSSKIDSVIKESDAIAKEQKKAQIIEYFNENNANLIDFNKVFKESWLNKSVRIKSVFTDIDLTLAAIEKDIQTIESLGNDVDVLRTYYLDTLNLANTVQYGCRLKEQRERAAKAEAEKAIAEQAKKEADAASVEAEKTAKAVNPFNAPPANNPIWNKQTVEPEPKEELYTRAFKVTTNREKIIALGNFMNENGIDFDKIEL